MACTLGGNDEYALRLKSMRFGSLDEPRKGGELGVPRPASGAPTISRCRPSLLVRAGWWPVQANQFEGLLTRIVLVLKLIYRLCGLYKRPKLVVLDMVEFIT